MINLTHSILLLSSLAYVSGLVKDLRCSYDGLWKKSLLCEWLEPEQDYSTAPLYHVNPNHNGKLVWQMWIESHKIEKKIHLNDKEAYTVYVRVLKPELEKFTETYVNFTFFWYVEHSFSFMHILITTILNFDYPQLWLKSCNDYLLKLLVK